MEEKLDAKVEDAACAVMDYVKANPGESAQEFKAGIDAYKELKEIESKEQNKETWKTRLIKLGEGILVVLIPSLAVEAMKERFKSREADKERIFSKEGTITTVSGKSFLNSIFKD